MSPGTRLERRAASLRACSRAESPHWMGNVPCKHMCTHVCMFAIAGIFNMIPLEFYVYGHRNHSKPHFLRGHGYIADILQS